MWKNNRILKESIDATGYIEGDYRRKLI